MADNHPHNVSMKAITAIRFLQVIFKQFHRRFSAFIAHQRIHDYPASLITGRTVFDSRIAPYKRNIGHIVATDLINFILQYFKYARQMITRPIFPKVRMDTQMAVCITFIIDIIRLF